jgi:hypothetical protein
MAKKKDILSAPKVDGLKDVKVTNETVTKSVKVQNVDSVEETANVLDMDEFEPISKKEFFSTLKSLCGIEEFDRNETAESLANDLASGIITGAEFFKKLAELSKESQNRNKRANSLNFEEIISKIKENFSEEEIILNIGSNDFSLISSKLTDSNYIYIWHKEQSENESKNWEKFPIIVSSAHKKYITYSYRERVEESTINVIRSLRSFSTYLSAYKKSEKQKKDENDMIQRFKDLAANIMDKFGYTLEETRNLI